ncbi:MAG: hypothetical protein V1915_04080 [Candidatus Bathyarchaeota archaeon]
MMYMVWKNALEKAVLEEGKVLPSVYGPPSCVTKILLNQTRCGYSRGSGGGLRGYE